MRRVSLSGILPGGGLTLFEASTIPGGIADRIFEICWRFSSYIIFKKSNEGGFGGLVGYKLGLTKLIGTVDFAFVILLFRYSWKIYNTSYVGTFGGAGIFLTSFIIAGMADECSNLIPSSLISIPERGDIIDLYSGTS